MQKQITTIKLSKKSVEILNKLKVHPRQSYEEVILKYIPKIESGVKNKNRTIKK